MIILKEIFFPARLCSFCGRTVNNRYLNNKENLLVQRLNNLPGICSSCKSQLKIPMEPFCSYCQKPLIKDMALCCDDCKKVQNRSFIYNRSAILYNEFARELIALYKYRGKQSLAYEFGYLITSVYYEYFNNLKIDYVTFVPIHFNRLHERGFNQAELLAVQLCNLIGKPLLDSLERAKDTDKQSKQSKKERFKQIEDIFILQGNIQTTIMNKNILIIDDIYTTGATITECANVLLSAGAKKIYSLTLARAYDI